MSVDMWILVSLNIKVLCKCSFGDLHDVLNSSLYISGPDLYSGQVSHGYPMLFLDSRVYCRMETKWPLRN